jgi:hypothetical protein
VQLQKLYRQPCFLPSLLLFSLFSSLLSSSPRILLSLRHSFLPFVHVSRLPSPFLTSLSHSRPFSPFSFFLVWFILSLPFLLFLSVFLICLSPILHRFFFRSPPFSLVSFFIFVLVSFFPSLNSLFPHPFALFLLLHFSLFLISRIGMRMSPLYTSATNWPMVPNPDMIDVCDCGAVGGMRIGSGNQNTLRKPASVLFVHHKSHMTWSVLEPGPPQWEAGD